MPARQDQQDVIKQDLFVRAATNHCTLEQCCSRLEHNHRGKSARCINLVLGQVFVPANGLEERRTIPLLFIMLSKSASVISMYPEEGQNPGRSCSHDTNLCGLSSVNHATSHTMAVCC
jgi:hypothetical protein